MNYEAKKKKKNHIQGKICWFVKLILGQIAQP